MQSFSAQKRVLLLSTVHPATDPRIVGKIAPSLSPYYAIKILLPLLDSPLAWWQLRMPFFKRLIFRILICHPFALVAFIRFRPHIVHIFVAELLPLAFVFRWLGAEIIYEVQENLHKKISIKTYNRGWIFQHLFYYFDQKARQYFKLIFTEDAYLNEYKFLSKPSAVIHNFAASCWLSMPPPKPNLLNPTFFYAGVISYERAFDTLMKAVIIVKKKYPNICLRLFGHLRIASTDLHDSADYKLVKENLTFYDYIPQKQAFEYTQDALAGIVLLKPVGDYTDSYPTKLFDYMALALPVIASDLPLLKDVILTNDCGFCVSPYSEDNLALQMIWCIENTDNLQKIGLNGRMAVIEKYNWEQESSKLLALYRA